jgi:hypothetical protein
MTAPDETPASTDSNETWQRWADRMPHAGRVMVVHGESAWFAELLDCSEGGCGLLRPADCMLDLEDVIRLFFYSDTHPVVIVTARVARITEAQLGIEYHEPQPIPPAPADQ